MKVPTLYNLHLFPSGNDYTISAKSDTDAINKALEISNGEQFTLYDMDFETFIMIRTTPESEV